MKDYCANPKCGKELIHVEGRKKKKYCNQKCNNADWQKRHYIPSTKIPKTKRIPIEEYQKLVQGIMEGTPEPTKSTIQEKAAAMVNDIETKIMSEPSPDKSEIEKQIAEIRKEKIPAHRDTVFGRKSWKIEQQKRVFELEEKLKSKP